MLLLTCSVLTALAQTSGSQPPQQPPPAQAEKKKAKKVWTEDDLPARPAESSAASAQAAPAASGTAAQTSARPQPAKPGEAKEAAEADTEAESVEVLEKQLETLARSRQSYEQQIEEARVKMREAPDDRRYEQARENLDALETFIQRNEEDTATVQAKLAEARKRAKQQKPAQPARAPQPAPPPQNQ